MEVLIVLIQPYLQYVEMIEGWPLSTMTTVNYKDRKTTKTN